MSYGCQFLDDKFDDVHLSFIDIKQAKMSCGPHVEGRFLPSQLLKSGARACEKLRARKGRDARKAFELRWARIASFGDVQP